MSRRHLATVLWGALLCWACAILWLSSLTPDELPDAAFAFWDKVNHVVAFTIGGWLAATALRISRPRAGRKNLAVAAILLIAVFGAVDEAIQTFTPGRTGGDPADWTADVIGAGAGALLSLRAPIRRRR